MIDALPADIGNVEETIHAAHVDERTVIGDVLDHPVEDLALGDFIEQLATGFGARLFHDGAAGNHDVATLAVHFQDEERLWHVHQRGDVLDWADVNL